MWWMACVILFVCLKADMAATGWFNLYSTSYAITFWNSLPAEFQCFLRRKCNFSRKKIFVSKICFQIIADIWIKYLEITLHTFLFSIGEMLCIPAEQGCVRWSVRHVGVSIPKHLCFKSLLKPVWTHVSKKSFCIKDCSLFQWEMEINNSPFKQLCFSNAFSTCTVPGTVTSCQ